MRSPLETRISVLRAQVRRLLALYGMSWVVAGSVLSILVAGLLDWLFHLSREVRVIELVALLGLVGWLLARFVAAPLFVRFRDLDIALRIEERWPGLQDRLATTIQFLALQGPEDREDVRGSRQLREETIRRTLAEAEAVDFRTVVDPRPARSAMISAALPIALGLVLVVAAPSTCKTALDRLFSPFGSARWPKQTHLTILEPNHDGRKIARGEPFLLEVGVGPNEGLPSDGVVNYTFDNGETLTRRLGTKLGDNPRLVDRLPEVARSFRYTVRAGDDATEVRGVVVVPPPSLVSARVTLRPPAYSGEPVSVVEPASGKTMLGVEFDLDRVLQGTEVIVEARTNKPVTSSALNLLGSAPWEPEKTAQTTTETAPVEAPQVTLGSDGQTVVTRFTARSSGRFSFDMTDTEGFRSQDRESLRFQVNSQTDLPPQVVLVEPPGNRDVTANALVPFLVQSEDDFGLGKVWLSSKISIGGSEPVDRDPLVLWVPDEPAAGTPAHKPTRKLETPYTWDLSSIEPPLEPGSVITVAASAVDLDNLGGPKTGKSREITLRILAPEQVAEQLEEQRRAIREEIARAKNVQDQAITPVQNAKRTLRQVDQLPPEQKDELTNAETIQRQVSGRVSDPNEGLIRKVERFLEDQQNLKLDNADTRAQMQQVLNGLERIRDNHLNPAEQSLTRANKALDQNNPNAQPQPGRQDQPKNPEQDPGRVGTAHQNPDPQNPQQGQDSQPKGQQGQDAQSKGQQGQQGQQTGQQGEQSQPTNQSGQQQKGQQQAGQQGQQSKGQQGQDAQQKGQQGQQQQAGQQSKGQQGQQQAGQQGQKQDGQQPNPEDEPTRAGQELARAEQEQQAIAQELDQMLQDLNEFETARGLAEEAKNLLKEQQDTTKAAAEAAEKHALEGKMPDQVAPEAKAELDNLAAKQEQIGEKLAQLENKMGDLAKRDENADPLAAEALAEAARKSRDRQTTEKARQAGEQLAQNQTGRAGRPRSRSSETSRNSSTASRTAARTTSATSSPRSSKPRRSSTTSRPGKSRTARTWPPPARSPTPRRRRKNSRGSPRNRRSSNRSYATSSRSSKSSPTPPPEPAREPPRPWPAPANRPSKATPMRPRTTRRKPRNTSKPPWNRSRKPSARPRNSSPWNSFPASETTSPTSASGKPASWPRSRTTARCRKPAS